MTKSSDNAKGAFDKLGLHEFVYRIFGQSSWNWFMGVSYLFVGKMEEIWKCFMVGFWQHFAKETEKLFSKDNYKFV